LAKIKIYSPPLNDMRRFTDEELQKIRGEIEFFEKYIGERYPSLSTNEGISNRIKILLFTHRSEFMEAVDPYSILFYCRKFNFSTENIHKILRRSGDLDVGGYTCRSRSGSNYFGNLTNGWGAADRKMRRAIKIAKVLCPEIFDYRYNCPRLQREK
jgi:hypothetical protein